MFYVSFVLIRRRPDRLQKRRKKSSLPSEASAQAGLRKINGVHSQETEKLKARLHRGFGGQVCEFCSSMNNLAGDW